MRSCNSLQQRIPQREGRLTMILAQFVKTESQFGRKVEGKV